MAAARERRSAIVTHMPVHGLVTAATDADYRARVNNFEIVAPDGHPVRWALNHFHSAALTDRCYGHPHASPMRSRGQTKRRSVSLRQHARGDRIAFATADGDDPWPSHRGERVAPVSTPHARRRRGCRRAPQCQRRGTGVPGLGLPAAGHLRFRASRPGPCRANVRGSRFRFSRRYQATGAGMDAAQRPRMAFSPGIRTPAAMEAIPGNQFHLFMALCLQHRAKARCPTGNLNVK